LNKVSFSLIWLALAVVLALSCKSAPKSVKEVPPEPKKVEELVVEPEVKEDAVIVEEIPEVVEADEDPVVVEPEDEELLTRKQAMYEELGETLTAARTKRQELMNSELDDQYGERFDLADESLNSATASYEAGLDAVDEVALVSARSALNGFTSIIDDALLAKAESLKSTSDDIRQQALKLKADTAVKQNYNFAAELHAKGNAAMSGKDYAAAAGFYHDAIPAFMEVINIATEKRMKAELALKNAEEKIGQSERILEEAVKELEAGENGEIL
jgi:hypothetical protein